MYDMDDLSKQLDKIYELCTQLLDETTLSCDMETYVNDDMDELIAENAQKDEAIEELETQIGDLESRVDDLECELDDVRCELSDAQETIDQLEHELEEALASKED